MTAYTQMKLAFHVESQPVSIILMLALIVPAICIFSTGPFPSFYNQVAALLLWGMLIYVAVGRFPKAPLNRQDFALIVMTAAVASIICYSTILTGLPQGISIRDASIMWSAIGVAALGINASKLNRFDHDFGVTFVIAIAIAAILESFTGLIELLAPHFADDHWIAKAASIDRIAGNVRQPNLLATISVWGLAAFAAISELKITRWRWLAPGAFILILVLSATGSRVGIAELVVIAMWGVFDKKLSSLTRRILLLTPIILFLCLIGLRFWSSWTGVQHFRSANLTTSRYLMWQQCMTLVDMHPWFGVGWGNFNFAWTLTPSQRNNPAMFDNAHNILLQLLVELGLPLTATLFCLVGWSLCACIRNAKQAIGRGSVVRRFCIVFIVIMLVHSMTEYPLWYAYFLFPTAFAWGIAASTVNSTLSHAPNGCMDKTVSMASATLKRNAQAWREFSNLRFIGLAMALAAACAMYEYQRIVIIYHPYDDTPIEQRVTEGRKSFLYGYLADRFAGTLAVNGARNLEPFRTATRQLLDMRLLIAWSLAMRESGQLDKARYLAQRVKDFNDPVSHQFFAPCNAQPRAENSLPWQCTAPNRKYTYEDFL